MAAFRSLHGSSRLFSLLQHPSARLQQVSLARTATATTRFGSGDGYCHHHSSNNNNQRGGGGGGGRSWLLTTQCRHYTPMTGQEEEQEKQRVAGLTAFAKEQELRKLNREIARLQMLHGINTGELYTWTGKYKNLARDYGFPLVAWYWSVWGVTALACYAAIEIGGIDAMALVARADAYTGWDLVSRIDPNIGKLGLVLVMNELVEPLRLPLVIVTVKPVMDKIFPPKF